ncbi:hypothetical protein Salat_1444100 [Sesamum alatum]|uniref:Phospholipase-like protein n=1 Tax=Sesamum alatum TaxID=300844 RepID=A0AAE2CLX4_9LAMI|nr:hypothetical protein Salat_1444100 [Sesamum alatum]
MVKKEENANFCLPDSWVGPPSGPDAPSGFLSQPPKSSTSAAVESSRNQNPSSQENGFSHGESPDPTGQPRCTSRKRLLPQFYSPSPAREVSGPIHGIALNNRMNLGMDPKILQHVAKALRYMAGSEACLDKTKVLKPVSSDIDKTLLHTLKAINKKHGDITQNCSLELDCMKTLVLLGICKGREEHEGELQWLHDRLDEINVVVILSEAAKGMVDERNRRLENIDNRKKEMSMCKVEVERLMSEIEGIEDQLAREVIMVDQLNRKIGAQISEF